MLTIVTRSLQSKCMLHSLKQACRICLTIQFLYSLPLKMAAYISVSFHVREKHVSAMLFFSKINQLANADMFNSTGKNKWLLTSVSGVRTSVYFFRISMRAILISMRANLIPMQLRGPQPKGMWQRAGRFAFSSGVNLYEDGRERWERTRKKKKEEREQLTVTFLGQISLVLASILDCAGWGEWGAG